MQANYERMLPWWSMTSDRRKLTDEVAFLQHRRQWDRRLHRGEGACLGFIGPTGLVGELQLWHLSPGGLTAEIGLWISPDPGVVGKEWVGCMGYVLDRMMGELGIQRVEGPVAAGNEGPRSVFQFLGFEVEARLERWRELHGELVDYDLFALTPSRWDKAREGAVDRVGGWAPARQP